MNQSETQYQKEAHSSVARMMNFVCLLSGICYALYALVLAPLYTQLSADITTQDAFYTIILDYLLPTLDLVVYTGVYAAIIYAVWRGGFAKAWRVPLVFSFITLGKYICNFFMTCVTDGGFPSLSIFVEEDLPIMGESILLEMLQLWGMVCVVSLIRRKRVKNHAYAMLSERHPTDERSLAFPMKNLLSYKNPVQWMTLWSAVIMLVGRLYMHLIYQLALLVFNGQADSAAVVLFDLFSDILIAAAFYFVVILLLAHFDKKDMERLAKNGC